MELTKNHSNLYQKANATQMEKCITKVLLQRGSTRHYYYKLDNWEVICCSL